MDEAKGKATYFKNIEATVYGFSAPGTSIRKLISRENDNAPMYDLRMIEIEPTGFTPFHKHPYEHENFVVEGNGLLLIGEKWFDLYPGVVALVPPNVEHQFKNTGDIKLRFLCGIPSQE